MSTPPTKRKPMPWWGWLLVAVLGAGLLAALAFLAYLLWQMYHMFDSF